MSRRLVYEEGVSEHRYVQITNGLRRSVYKGTRYFNDLLYSLTHTRVDVVQSDTESDSDSNSSENENDEHVVVQEEVIERESPTKKLTICRKTRSRTRLHFRENEKFTHYDLSLAALIVVICFLITFFLMRFRSPAPTIQEKVRKIFEHYPSLSKDDKRTLLFAINKLTMNMDKELSDTFGTQTIIISGNDSANLLNQLNQAIKDTINPSIGKAMKVSKDTKRASLFKKVHQSIIHSSKRGPILVCLSNIESLVWEAPLVLHAICDPDTNQSGDMLVLLSLTEQKPHGVTCDDHISGILSDNWRKSGGNNDNIPPILSRIMDFSICL